MRHTVATGVWLPESIPPAEKSRYRGGLAFVFHRRLDGVYPLGVQVRNFNCGRHAQSAIDCAMHQVHEPSGQQGGKGIGLQTTRGRRVTAGVGWLLVLCKKQKNGPPF